MNAIKGFLNYVEIKNKITSVLTFLMTLTFLFVSGKAIDRQKTLVFFAGMLFFDLTATAINNYCDTKNNRQTLQFKRRTALVIIIVLLAISLAFGLYLVYLTDLAVLFLGALCFLFGIMYSFGPVPISHGPYGEIVSGLFYGLLIPFLLVYINTPEEVFVYALKAGRLSFEGDIITFAKLFLLAQVPCCLTANIMLANNICDLQNDVQVKRFTLPYYLKGASLHLFAALYYLAYASVIAMVIFRLISPLSLLLLLTLPWVQKNIRRFYRRQDKETTFMVSIQNFIIIITAHTLLMLLGGLFANWSLR
ncbi:MAG: UbiA family prenyltransferase [Clostridiales bacterium]|nr:UbiA family prenyltransferase [Clostridiales bacterium]